MEKKMTFDYIVVGTGPAGAVLAKILSDDKILLLSGIGPAAMLREANIPVIFNNPNVEQRLRNHTLNFAVFSTNRNDRALPVSDPDALYTGGSFLPDSTGTDPHQRVVQFIGIASDGMLTNRDSLFASEKPRIDHDPKERPAYHRVG
ncbi:hypothetical protein [Paenibacillus popilliae]|uniref:Choline dehydrogenase n=1 Tax=Paenibacillus popilliae ATCC 14706 TaxID=1212764 RepID=M9LBP1_PAEPP|nr:hypothetical protein [Paenibacillus popilliae]GAC43317.1 choline dehydrogenase [Paenibacillus popilliae ATCC 14706]